MFKKKSNLRIILINSMSSTPQPSSNSLNLTPNSLTSSASFNVTPDGTSPMRPLFETPTQLTPGSPGVTRPNPIPRAEFLEELERMAANRANRRDIPPTPPQTYLALEQQPNERLLALKATDIFKRAEQVKAEMVEISAANRAAALAAKAAAEEAKAAATEAKAAAAEAKGVTGTKKSNRWGFGGRKSKKNKKSRRK
jgi:hypothetical protein